MHSRPWIFKNLGGQQHLIGQVRIFRNSKIFPRDELPLVPSFILIKIRTRVNLIFSHFTFFFFTLFAPFAYEIPEFTPFSACTGENGQISFISQDLTVAITGDEKKSVAKFERFSIVRVIIFSCASTFQLFPIFQFGFFFGGHLCSFLGGDR